MNQYEQINEYDSLIKKISKKRKLIIALDIILLIVILAVTTPGHLEIFERTIIDTKGIHPIFTILMILLVSVIVIIAYAIVSIPISASMDVECDPQKYLALNTALTKGKELIPAYATGYLYMGNFPLAMEYAGQMITSGKQNLVLSGIFNKVRCEFLLGNYEAMKISVQQYESVLSNIKKSTPAYQKLHEIMILLCAIADKDLDKINEYRKSIQAWSNSKAAEGYINYLKGISAYSVGDKDESIYRFMLVKDHCEKTVFSQLSDEYLSLLK